eukprot:CAMPEP_0113504610 /NCGR_PEP_ID=MMETSP0014_2-20120614/34808_1 /TAXON_ID=2857 /ORGANISM="Nitzschia sp." /LENGTH=142 /DNA_ID=CAMNT_0000399733 /DNA_START=80 /DNA_END=508 /DNA_ORIENTATION=- /assembly_acc=CAM_ASM_000159
MTSPSCFIRGSARTAAAAILRRSSVSVSNSNVIGRSSSSSSSVATSFASTRGRTVDAAIGRNVRSLSSVVSSSTAWNNSNVPFSSKDESSSSPSCSFSTHPKSMVADDILTPDSSSSSSTLSTLIRTPIFSGEVCEDDDDGG